MLRETSEKNILAMAQNNKMKGNRAKGKANYEHFKGKA